MIKKLFELILAHYNLAKAPFVFPLHYHAFKGVVMQIAIVGFSQINNK